MFSTVLDYFTGIKMYESRTRSLRRFWFWLSISINLGFLGVFKYFNFFAESMSEAFAELGFQVNPWSLAVILPVGISFYTFHGLSYVIDIYKDRIKPERNFIDYALFVSFFPLLVAGPIERATHLLPQIQQTRVFKYARATDGLKQILWGLFKKMVIADNCALYANEIFGSSAEQPGIMLALGAIFFTFQIYGDFSGYSDIALGTARLFGIELLKNFNFPYFSRDIAEFWRRWHISLSTWFRDYLYIPLGGSKGNTLMKVRNTFIIFLVSGFWHGANWTFIAWGFLNALFIMPSILFATNRNNLGTVAEDRLLPNFKELLQMLITFSLTVIAWIFFRAESLRHAFSYIGGMFSKSLFMVPHFENRGPIITMALIVIFLLIEWQGRTSNYAIERIGAHTTRPVRWALLSTIIFLIGMHMQTEESPFIYFQF
jgi:D-alanyl-lipoteichoic acid acyltransferase DltB (MBOAT superfamily)